LAGDADPTAGTETVESGSLPGDGGPEAEAGTGENGASPDAAVAEDGSVTGGCPGGEKP
jgi:hypothetical protein